MILGIGKFYFMNHELGLMQCSWFYKSNLTPDEVLLIKCFDSKLDGRARRVPHTAFKIPNTEDKEARESIEVRALVFHENDSLE
jgi:hypothetical protein